MDEYIIQGSTLRNLADQARLLTGESGTMSFSEIAAAFEDAAANGTGISGAHDEILYRKNGTDGSIIYVPPIATTLSSSYFPESITSYITSVSLPGCTGLGGVSIFGSQEAPVTLELPAILSIPGYECQRCDSIGEITMTACTAIGEQSFGECGHLNIFRAPSCVSVGASAFYECRELTTVILNSACAIEYGVFENVLDPDNKTLRIYFVGSVVGQCSQDVLGSYSYSSGGGDGNGSESSGSQQDVPIPGIEIYVPVELMNEFQENWAGGMFANNIYPLPAVLP